MGQSHDDDAYDEADISNPLSLLVAFRHFLHKVLTDPTGFLTLGLVASTAALWLSTRRLWQGAEAQHLTLKASVEEARKAANAANASAAAYRSAERAWVGVTRMNSNKFQNGIIDGAFVKEGVTVSFSVTNSGRTPAINLVLYSDFKVIEFDSQDVPIFEEELGDNEPNKSILVPGAAGTGRYFGLNEEDTKKFLSRRAQIIMYCLVILRRVR